MAQKNVEVIAVAGASKPVDKRNELKSLEVEIDLSVNARNADSKNYRDRVECDGRWKPDLWEHLPVTALTPL